MLPMYEHCLQTMFSKTQTLTLYAQYSIILPNIDLRQSRVLNISQAQQNVVNHKRLVLDVQYSIILHNNDKHDLDS